MAHAPLNRLAARTLALLALLSALALPGARPVSATPALAPAKAAAAQETPPLHTLVPEDVSNFIVANSTVFWYTHCSYNSIGTINRIPVQGGESRQIYKTGKDCSSPTSFRSNIVADADYVYWASDSGLLRLSTNATVGDQPQVLSAAAASWRTLVIDNDAIYSLHATGSPAPTDTYTITVQQVAKADGTTTTLTTHTEKAEPIGFQVSHAFSEVSGASDYLYWRGSDGLMRYNLNTGALDNILSTLSVFYAEGGVTSCENLRCTTTDRVYFSYGQQVSYYNNYDGTTTPVYTAPYQVYDLITDKRHLFVHSGFYYGNCSPRCSFFSSYLVTRSRREASRATTYMYGDFRRNWNLTIANGYLLWQNNDTLRRLPTDVGLPHLYMPGIRR
ncbi:MAG TPA: hypothetical protein VFS21_06105 [Roseiflexaceae bacterium]|nr:hypothetical protein [Roseiflexaceae bacterium]